MDGSSVRFCLSSASGSFGVPPVPAQCQDFRNQPRVYLSVHRVPGSFAEWLPGVCRRFMGSDWLVATACRLLF